MATFNENQLPYTAKSLCAEALTVALDLTAGVSEETVLAEEARFLKHSTAMAEVARSQEVSIGGFDLFTMFDQFSKKESPDEVMQSLGIGDDKAELVDDLKSDIDKKVLAALIGKMMTSAVEALKSKERSLLDISATPDLKEAMDYLDEEIYLVSSLLSTAKTLKPGIEFLSGKVARKKGAKKGGVARSQKYEEVHSMVIEEARSLHSDKKGAQAARAIFEKLGQDGSWLIDENGNPISVDPVTLFTKWINKDRKTSGDTPE